MALFRRLFYRKPPDRLLEISDRVYVFDCCFSADILKEDEYKVYMDDIVAQLQDHFPDASFMVFNFRDGEKRNRVSDILSEYDMTVMDYPREYEGCPLLPLEMIHHFLRSCESWLSVEGQHNVVLMHCERGGWPVLAFMLAGLLLYRKQYAGEEKTLEMVYKQAPKELLHLLSPVNPQPSHLRYLQYILRRGNGPDLPPADKPKVADQTKRATSMENTSHLQRRSSFSCIPLDTCNWCSSLRFSRRSSDDKSHDDVHDPLHQSPISSKRLMTFARWRELWRRIVSEKRKILSSTAPMQVCHDEYSYAKNFDEGVAWIELDNLCRSFSKRFAVPSSTFLLQREP